MRGLSMRGLSMRGLLALAVTLVGCGPTDEGTRYLDDAQFRRDALVASLEVASNRYAAVRLASYERSWSQLPEWNPPTETLDDRFLPAGDEARLELDASELGRLAFFRYPVQAIPRLDRDHADWDALGVDHAPGFGGGLVLERVADGTQRPSLTCASCHARVVDGAIVPGLANQDLALGALFGAPWPRGQLDVSLGTCETPVAIPDLRAVSLQRSLQAAAAVKNDRIALAIRIETLIITAHGSVVRPPRVLALALADYLISLAPPTTVVDGAGATQFAETCAGCHAGEQRSGGLVDAELVGTDPRSARSLDRGTGSYRVPSLRGVGTRGALLHDASVRDVEALLDPAREGGHRFGLTLDGPARASLVAFLRSL